MKIYDISQELLNSVVFPGDEAPKREQILDMKKGDGLNLSLLRMCLHNGTHMDAPNHFCNNESSIDTIPLETVIGEASVVEHQGILTREDVYRIFESREIKPRILWKGNTTVSLEAAQEMTRRGVLLVGNESQTVGPEDAPRAVHLELLGKGVVLLEGIRLGHVPEGNYLLNAAPINIKGAEGSPCRAVLITKPKIT